MKEHIKSTWASIPTQQLWKQFHFARRMLKETTSTEKVMYFEREMREAHEELKKRNETE